jgi:hypothetical protein
MQNSGGARRSGTLEPYRECLLLKGLLPAADFPGQNGLLRNRGRSGIEAPAIGLIGAGTYWMRFAQ